MKPIVQKKKTKKKAHKKATSELKRIVDLLSEGHNWVDVSTGFTLYKNDDGYFIRYKGKARCTICNMDIHYSNEFGWTYLVGGLKIDSCKDHINWKIEAKNAFKPVPSWWPREPLPYWY